MRTYKPALSLLLSPIARGSALARIGVRRLSTESGLPIGRIRDVYAMRGDPLTIEEAARLAAVVDQEISIIPESCGGNAFMEVEDLTPAFGDTSSNGLRVVAMLEKVADLCIDFRLATGMSNEAFEKTHGYGPEFMACLADFSRYGSVTVARLHDYLVKFGATLASFPRRSDYTNYYTALAAAAPVSQVPAMKVA